jgi:hypothetical protein
MLKTTVKVLGEAGYSSESNSIHNILKMKRNKKRR